MEKPNGPPAAAFLAGGIGCAVLGILTFINLTEPTSAFSKWLSWYKPVGSLAGKSSLAILAFLGTWIVLGVVWRQRQVNFKVVAVVAFVLLAIGLLGTFPPVWWLVVPLPPPS